MRRVWLTSLLLSSLLVSPALAAGPGRVTVEAAVGQAVAHNPAIRAADRALEAARARLTQAEAWPNPNLALMVDQVPVTNPAAGNYMAGVSQPLLPGGAREARSDAARIEVELAAIARDLVARELVAEVKVAYVRHQFDHEEVRTATLALEAADAALKAAAARYKAGELARIDVLRAEVERGRARRDLAVAESREQRSLTELNVLLGREAQAALEVESPVFGVVPALGPLGEVLAIAVHRRPELRQAELTIRREAAQRHVAQAGLWTGTEATLAGGLVGGQPGMTSTLTVPIPVYRQQGEIAEAEASRARAEAERDVVRHRVTLEAERAYHDAAIAARQAQLHRSDLLPQAERLADNAQRRYNVGEGSGLEIAEARRALRQAQADHHRALLDFRQALVRLEHAIGGAVPPAR